MGLDEMKDYIRSGREAYEKEKQPNLAGPSADTAGYRLNRPFYKSRDTGRKRMRWLFVDDGRSISSMKRPVPDVIPAVNDMLPRFKGKQCAEWIQDKVDNAGQGLVEILDVGCGDGTAANDIKNRYPDKVKVTGLTAFFPKDGKPLDSVIIGDVFQAHLPYAEYDVIYSANTAVHTQRHVLDFLLKIYPWLKDDGIAFVESSGIFNSQTAVEGLASLNEFLNMNGYDFEINSYPLPLSKDRTIHSIGFRKTKPKLFLPRSYVFNSQGKLERVTIDLTKVPESPK